MPVALGGLFGTAARQAVEEALPTPGETFPVATFVINMSGAFLLGLVLEGLTRPGPDTGWWRVARLALGPGFLGAFTTYSTLAIESDLLVRHAHFGMAAGYMAASVVAGLAAASIGMVLGMRIGRVAHPEGPG
jgi:fluoride exporter